MGEAGEGAFVGVIDLQGFFESRNGDGGRFRDLGEPHPGQFITRLIVHEVTK